MNYLSIAAMFRDEAACLREWLLFHLMNGVDHFRLYDNGSTDDFLGAIQDLVVAGVVDLVRWEDGTDQSQRNMYHHAIESLRGQSRWVAFIDVDEFLFSPAALHLCQLLGDFERFPGVVVNWQIYGSSGLEQRDGLVLDSFTRRAPRSYFRNFRVKSVVDPAQVESASGAHFFTYTNGRKAVDSARRAGRRRGPIDLLDPVQAQDPLACRFGASAGSDRRSTADQPLRGQVPGRVPGQVPAVRPPVLPQQSIPRILGDPRPERGGRPDSGAGRAEALPLDGPPARSPHPSQATHPLTANRHGAGGCNDRVSCLALGCVGRGPGLKRCCRTGRCT